MSGSSNYTPAQNASDRMSLLRGGVPMTANIGTYGPFAPGQSVQIKLRNVGVITRLRARVTATLDITAAMTASPFGPYCALKRVSTQDYNSTLRINSSGMLLKLLDDTRLGRPYLPTGQGLTDTDQVQVPTAANGAAPFEFQLEIPVCRDRMNDLTGAILAQTVVGELFLNMTFNNLVGDVSCPYTAGAATTAGFYVEVLQDYIQPQPNAQGQVALPLIDLNTVYEFNAVYQSSDSITGGGQKYIDYPNVRNVLSHTFVFVNDGAVTVNGTDIEDLVLIANGNTNLLENDPLFNRAEIRNRLGGDWPAGAYFYSHRGNPIQTNIYSQVQSRIDFAQGVSGTGSYIAYGFEDTYMLNTPLPGIASGS
jgi:hypothetical protein